MKKKSLRIVAIAMLTIGVVFVLFALGHPELSWHWGNGISYILYFVYVAISVALLIISFKKR